MVFTPPHRHAVGNLGGQTYMVRHPLCLSASRSYLAIAQWVGGCLRSHSGEGRGLNPRGGSHLGLFPARNRDFGVTKGSGGIGLSWDIRLWGDIRLSRDIRLWGTSGSEGGERLGTPSHGTRTLNIGFNKDLYALIKVS